MKKIRLSERELTRLINRVVLKERKDTPWWKAIVEVTPFARVFKMLKIIENKSENDDWTDAEITLAEAIGITLPGKLAKALKAAIKVAEPTKKEVEESDIRRLTRRVMSEWAPHTGLQAFEDDVALQVDTSVQPSSPSSTVTAAMINDCESYLMGVPGGNTAWIQTTKNMVFGKDCDWLMNKYDFYAQAVTNATPGSGAWQRKRARQFFIECLLGKCLNPW